MGEIGIPRREFLYDIRFWEVRRIIRGYRQRDLLKHQLMAECAYAAIYAMRDTKGKTVADMFPMLFDNEEADEQILSEKERDEMLSLIDAVNEQGNE